jgi:hypothetical protein
VTARRTPGRSHTHSFRHHADRILFPSGPPSSQDRGALGPRLDDEDRRVTTTITGMNGPDASDTPRKARASDGAPTAKRDDDNWYLSGPYLQSMCLVAGLNPATIVVSMISTPAPTNIPVTCWSATSPASASEIGISPNAANMTTLITRPIKAWST